MTKNSKHIILMVLLCLARIIIDIFAILLIFKYRVAIYGTLAMIFLCFAFAVYNFDNILTLPNPPMPEITYGEFPFEIVYSVDGEVFQKSDVIICECKVDYTPEYGKRLLFTEKYQSGTDNILCEKMGVDIRIDCGNPEYYLLSEKPCEDYVPGQYIYYEGYYFDYTELTSSEAKEQLGIEIISAHFSEPIENEFEYRTIDKIRLFIYDTFGIPVD